MTHMCIDAITRASSDFDYKVTVVHDACASKDLEFNGHKTKAIDIHHAYLAAFEFGGYAKIVSIEEMVRNLKT